MENVQQSARSTAVPDWEATADRIWATLDRVEQEQEETARRMRETEKLIKENAKQIGKLGNRFGEAVEHLIKPNLTAKFRELQFEFTKAGFDLEIIDRDHDIVLEVDVFLENGDKVMIVEVKSKPTIRDINDHIKRMEKLRVYADLHNDKRKYLGAIGGVVFSESEKLYALKKGFFVIEPSGDTFNITAPQGDCHPREW